MKRLRFLISLCTDDNDYQCEQAIDAEQAARQLGVDIEVLYAQNDSLCQSQQLLQAIQSSSSARPDAIVLEPVGGTALPVVARAAAAAGIGWVILNREADYIGEIRQARNLPVFSVTSNHEEVGRIQGQQFAALLPNGGSVLYIQGPTASAAAEMRTKGMNQTKPANIRVRMLRGHWTLESAQQAVRSWLQLSTSRESSIDLVGCQDDSMALGARGAFQELTSPQERERWLSLPYTGCDGLRTTGQKLVDEGLLAATVVIPPNTSLAMHMLVQAIQTGVCPPERTFTQAASYPLLELLGKPRTLPQNEARQRSPVRRAQPLR